MPHQPHDNPSQEWVSVTDWATLVESHRRQEAEVRALNVGHRLLADQMAEITVTLRRQDALIDENAKALKGIADSLTENTELTRSVRDAVTAGRVVNGLLKWSGGVIIAASAVWLAIKDVVVGRGGS